ncbi:S-adenosyl-L-methionine-dependent methyltransferase [Xylaria bambusicola]|uniref:S-adenosyl-L-methionine-dependent methyltransferase n=1 Tax=Xylaria bambusicola TaxID=326684 RepID=UPI0020084A94|nr:S-adenosyl-L-methionine-dependent methyltransferase [Xylaria bambusicola]KAI0508621.1 S-adenosyl-L-methionine-dependent methyltransferase [Xylaria bambusicola]
MHMALPPPTTNSPPQAIIKNVDLYAEITATSTQDVAKYIIQMILPGIAPGSKVHDNGCGAGEVTREIMSIPSTSGRNIAIDATDISSEYIERLEATAKGNGWPVTVHAMAAEKLDFADDTFHLSIANFVLFLTADGGVPALREMHRTLKADGTAVFTSWAKLPHSNAIKAAHVATRGPLAPSLRELPKEWEQGSHLVQVALDAGFAKEQVDVSQVPVFVLVDDLRRHANVMWSFLGIPTVGWLPSDNGSWDVAVDVLMGCFQHMDGFKILENGQMRIELVANVLVAHK